MGWDNRDEVYGENYDRAYDLSDYYSTAIGRNITFGVSANREFWVESNRTNGKEHFESIEEAERRVKLLYSDVLPEDWDEVDPLDAI